MTNDTNAIQTTLQAESPAANDDLELKSVGEGKLVVMYHRNAYGGLAVGVQGKVS